MRWLSSLARGLRFTVVSLFAFAIAVAALLLGAALAAALLGFAAVRGKGLARAAAAGRGFSWRRSGRPGVRSRAALDVVDVEFREKPWPDRGVGPA